MAKEQKQDPPAITNSSQHQGKCEEKELELETEEAEAEAEPEAPLPLTVTSRVLYMLGDITAGSAFRITQWLELVRKRTAKYRSSGFRHRHSRFLDTMPLSLGESFEDAKCDPLPEQTEISLWERLGKAAMLDVESSSFLGTGSLHCTILNTAAAMNILRMK